eukprot:2319894-Prymnesium_polylepis.1
MARESAAAALASAASSEAASSEAASSAAAGLAAAGPAAELTLRAASIAASPMGRDTRTPYQLTCQTVPVARG